MTKFRNYLIAPLGVMTILVTSLVSSNPAIAQTAPGPRVTIAGPLPLPVTGPVGISGTVPVKNIDEPGRNPFQVMVHCEASTNSCNTATPPVPVGKRLVLEHVNSGAQLRDPAVVTDWNVFIGSGTTGVVATLVPHFVADVPPLSNFAANESVLMFVEAGQSIVAQINTTSSQVLSMDMLFSGYLVDLSK